MVQPAFKAVWLVAMFDLPVVTQKHRRAYTRFRKELLKDGFIMLQLSVYARYCASEEASQVHRKRVREAIPEEGHVRVVTLTDHQFGKMELYVGKKSKEPENAPVQLEFF